MLIGPHIFYQNPLNVIALYQTRLWRCIFVYENDKDLQWKNALQSSQKSRNFFFGKSQFDSLHNGVHTTHVTYGTHYQARRWRLYFDMCFCCCIRIQIEVIIADFLSHICVFFSVKLSHFSTLLKIFFSSEKCRASGDSARGLCLHPLPPRSGKDSYHQSLAKTIFHIECHTRKMYKYRYIGEMYIYVYSQSDS